MLQRSFVSLRIFGTKRYLIYTTHSFFPCNDYNTMDPSSLQTLRRVEENDATFTELYIGGMEITSFNSSNSRDFSHLGASIAQNTNVKTLSFNFVHNLDAMNDEFFDGLKYNSSIDELILNCDGRGIVGGAIQELLEVYQENTNLRTLTSPNLSYIMGEIV